MLSRQYGTPVIAVGAALLAAQLATGGSWRLVAYGVATGDEAIAEAVVVGMRLPEPMLARSGPLPSGSGWRFEPKLDGPLPRLHARQLSRPQPERLEHDEPTAGTRV